MSQPVLPLPPLPFSTREGGHDKGGDTQCPGQQGARVLRVRHTQPPFPPHMQVRGPRPHSKIRFQSPFSAHWAHVCMCLCFLIPSKGPPPAPRFLPHSLHPSHGDPLSVPEGPAYCTPCAFCHSSLSLKCPFSPLHPLSPFSYLASSYSSSRVQPTASSSKKPSLILQGQCNPPP